MSSGVGVLEGEATDAVIPSVNLPAEMGAAELARRIRSGDLSARQVVEEHVRRIRATAHLNAVVVPRFEEALAAAEAADEARVRGEPLGPLHGVPITIKEQFRVVGTPTSLGVPSQKGWRTESEGPLVTRLRRAGAIILGKTNVPQLLLHYESDNPLYGRTANPWDEARSPGGSSGGEAAIIAAGGSALGLGGDLGGSLRVPAHFCGLHTLKPTSGRLTNEDNRLDLILSVYGRATVQQRLIVGQQGALARRVEDLRLAMRVLAGSGGDRAADEVAPSPWPDEVRIRVGALRVGFYVDDGFFPASPAIRRAVRQAGEAMQASGATVRPFRPPDVATAMRLFLSVLSADGARGFRRTLGKGPVTPVLKGMLRGGGAPRTVRRLVAGILAARGQRHMAAMVRWTGRRSEREFQELLNEAEAYRRRFFAAMDEAGVDVLLSPPFALPALTHGASEHLFPAGSYAVLYNVLGMPAGVVAATRVRPGEESDRPVSRDVADRTACLVERGSAGLPVGVQVAARPWREDIVLAVMAALEEAFSTRPDYPPLVGPTLEPGRQTRYAA